MNKKQSKKIQKIEERKELLNDNPSIYDNYMKSMLEGDKLIVSDSERKRAADWAFDGLGYKEIVDRFEVLRAEEMHRKKLHDSLTLNYHEEREYEKYIKEEPNSIMSGFYNDYM